MGREWLENYVLQTAPEHLAKLAAAKALYLGLGLNGENIILLSNLSDLTWIGARVGARAHYVTRCQLFKTWQHV